MGERGGSACHDFVFVAWITVSLQCFDAVGWAAGRASGL